MMDDPAASDNDNYIYSWLQDTVEAHQLILNKIAWSATSDFGRAHLAFRLHITCAVRRYGFLLRTPSYDICRPYLAIADRAVRTAVSESWTYRRSIS
jgi:hypothetical protein